MQELDDIISRATRAVEPSYFLLPLDGGDPIFRERVYCYELYHQMRLLWPPGCRFLLNGEVDKSAHPKLGALGAAYAKPDFLVHNPGRMEGNHAIIEVKSAQADREGIRKDLRTLSVFVRRVGYQRAIYLIYGEAGIDRVINKVLTAVDDVSDPVPIDLWVHPEAGTSAIAFSLRPNEGRLIAV